MSRPRILLADDHTLMVDALRHLLELDFDVVGTVADGRVLLAAAAELKPDLVVADIGMPLLNGLDAGEQPKALQPAIKVIYLTQNSEPKVAMEAFRREASGYVAAGLGRLRADRRDPEVLHGEYYVSSKIADQMPSDWTKPHASDENHDKRRHADR